MTAALVVMGAALVVAAAGVLLIVYAFDMLAEDER